jgi:hypothetical protein
MLLLIFRAIKILDVVSNHLILDGCLAESMVLHSFSSKSLSTEPDLISRLVFSI